MEENNVKKIISIFLILSILTTTLIPTFIFAKEQEKPTSQTKQIVMLQNVEKKETICSKAVNKFKNLFFKVNWTIFYYFMITLGLIHSFNKLGVFDKNKVYDDLKNKSYSDFISSIWSNIKSTPECLKLIYNKMKGLNINSESEQNKDICTEENKNSVEELACNVVNSIDTMNNSEEPNSKKISNFLRNLSKPAQSTTNAWDYLKTHGTLLWIGSSVGSMIGKLGLTIGTFNLGWLYGLIMIPYLWSYKNEKVGELEILANSIDITEDSWQKVAQKSNDLNGELKDLWQNVKQKFSIMSSCNDSSTQELNAA